MEVKMGLRKTNLFLRIALRLILPLLLLISTFTAIQLTNQLIFLNKIYEIQSRISLQKMTELLNLILEDPSYLQNTYLLRAKLEKAKEDHGVSEILILDPLTRETLYSERHGGGFTNDDLLASERALLDVKQGKGPLLLIDKETQKLNAFVPITTPLQQKVYIAKLAFPLGNLRVALEKSMGALVLMFLITGFAGFLIAGGLSRSIVKP
ncbi:MAG: hypothetical protein HY447_04310, partial [Candidatus Omnitrophica bacterium]|nr:hypothetical protein [Candidatus Omnitrophota bacterium]